MKVPLLDLVAQHQTIREEVMVAVTHVFDTQQFIMGAGVADFERAAAEYCGVKHAIGCASGSDALLLALMALGIGEGDEIITTAFTFFATASSITRLGARPVFVDIAYDDFNLNVDLIERAITPRTKAIMPVHLYGQCARMDVIAEVARNRVFVHAGVVGWKGRAIVIPGRSYSGKSTLVSELIRAGAAYYSDEYAVFDSRGRVYPFAKPLEMRDVVRHVEEIASDARALGG